MTGSRDFASLRAPQIRERLSAGSILVLPVGAIEQHGPHLPLNTDLVVAEAVVDATLATVGDEVDAWRLPALAVSKSNEHAWSPGTVWLSATTLLAVLDDLGRCIATTPAKRLVFLNGHGGNSALLNVANRELRLAHGLMTFLAHPGVPPDQGGLSPAHELGMGVHGGTDETSIMLHLAGGHAGDGMCQLTATLERAAVDSDRADGGQLAAHHFQLVRIALGYRDIALAVANAGRDVRCGMPDEIKIQFSTYST